MKLKYLITGTGRCGTVFMARFFTSLGIPCGHESVFDFNGLEIAKKKISGELSPCLSFISIQKWVDNQWLEEPAWLEDVTKIEAESSYMAAPYLNDSVLDNTTKIHIIRNPFKVISSFCHSINYFQKSDPSNKWEDFIYKNLPQLKQEMSQYDRASLFYILWNKMIEKSKPNFLFKIEDNLEKIIKFIRLDNKQFYNDKKTNSIGKNKKYFDLNMIESKEIKQEIIQFAKKYEYSSIFFN